MDAIELLKTAPNLAFGIICLWFVQLIQKERIAENARYAASLEKLNELYIQLLEKAVSVMATNASLSANNRDAIAKLDADIASQRSELGRLADAIERTIRDSTKRDAADRRNSQSRAGGD